jgi:hypothetical protein
MLKLPIEKSRCIVQIKSVKKFREKAELAIIQRLLGMKIITRYLF